MQLHIIARGKIGRSPEAELVERYLVAVTREIARVRVLYDDAQQTRVLCGLTWRF